MSQTLYSPSRLTGVLKSVLLVVLLSVAATTIAQAQNTTVNLSDNLTEEEFQAMLGRLSDEQVRDILIAEFAARRAEDPVDQEGLLGNSRDIGAAITGNAAFLFSKWPELGAAFAAVGQRLSAAGGIAMAFFAFALSLLAGFAVRYFWRQRAAQMQIALAERNAATGAYSSGRTILDAAFFLVIELSSSIAFALTAMAVLYLFFHDPDLRYFVSSYVAVVTVVLLVRSFMDFILPLNWPVYRLVALSDDATRLAHRVVLGLSAMWMFETVTTDVMMTFEAPQGAPDLISLMLGTLWIILALISIQLVNRATAELRPPLEDRRINSVIARNWAAILSVVQILTWLTFTVGALASGDINLIAASIFQSLLLFIGFWVSYRILVHYLRAQDMDDAVKQSIGSGVQVLLLATGVFLLLSIWGLDPQTLAATGLTGRSLQAVINVLLTALVGWAMWHFIRTLIDVRTAAEAPGEDDEDAAEGEGGLGASRTATLLPLLRTTAFVIIGLVCIFSALSSIGVNVAPLVAGAGVVGLAIGFGAQTLVRDIVSGIFFLIDDAFRRGEYIDLGSVKGTVERISVRSLQLRHHLGAVHTIPFGEIAALTNYSRDWVIMKLPLRLTFDTDPQQVKKLVKKIGAECMEDPIIKDGLLEPPKSQGVIQMEDSAMILRVKFKAVPGKQFTIRRELLHRIRAAFEDAGIRFASKEVTVRVNEAATPEEKRTAAGAAAIRSVEAENPAT
ncbi:MAG: mechanosensitive ion channel domain-containing protein [Pseudomonadota bacterium]